MKRLHQLSIHTAKQAINEMRLMQAYFNTPFYLLKFRQLNSVDRPENKCSYNNANHFWSITLGDCVIDDFSASIGVASLNKNSLIKKMDYSSYRIEHCPELFPTKKETDVNNGNKLALPDSLGQPLKPNNISNNSGMFLQGFYLRILVLQNLSIFLLDFLQEKLNSLAQLVLGPIQEQTQ